MFDMKQIGKKITDLRKSHNMTQMELADKLAISFQAVSNWERGNTMPDISKLPELAEIFHVSVDELLNGKAPLVAAVLNNTIIEYMEEGNVSEQEIADTLPLLKPEQAEDLLEKADVSSYQNLSAFLPFMHEEDIADLAFEALEQNESFNEYLPFMHEEDIATLANKLQERGDPISCLLPFMYEDDLRDFAIKALEKGDSIDEYLPFMDEDDVTQLALKILRSRKNK